MELTNAIVELEREREARAPSEGAETPPLVHALDVALERLRREAERRRRRPGKAFARWSPEDDASLVKRYEAGETETELASSFERTRGAVRTRLFLLGCLRLPEGEAPPTPRYPARASDA